MAEQGPSPSPSLQQVQASLHDIARVLRESHHLDPKTQQALGDLVDELGKTLQSGTLPAEETAHLASTASSLAKGLHERQHTTVLTAAKQKLEQAALRAEAEAPVATGIARQLIDTLANLGI
jgi:hypothetical protein